MTIKSSVSTDNQLSIPDFPILMESKKGTVFLFLKPKYAVCLRVGTGSEWEMGEGKTATMLGMQVFKGVLTLENE